MHVAILAVFPEATGGAGGIPVAITSVGETSVVLELHFEVQYQTHQPEHQFERSNQRTRVFTTIFLHHSPLHFQILLLKLVGAAVWEIS